MTTKSEKILHGIVITLTVIAVLMVALVLWVVYLITPISRQGYLELRPYGIYDFVAASGMTRAEYDEKAADEKAAFASLTYLRVEIKDIVLPPFEKTVEEFKSVEAYKIAVHKHYRQEIDALTEAYGLATYVRRMDTVFTCFTVSLSWADDFTATVNLRYQDYTVNKSDYLNEIENLTAFMKDQKAKTAAIGIPTQCPMILSDELDVNLLDPFSLLPEENNQ